MSAPAKWKAFPSPNTAFNLRQGSACRLFVRLGAIGTLPGRYAHNQNGSLQLVVVPEPSIAFLGGLSLVAMLRRRR